MNTTPPRRRAPQGQVVARVAVVLGLAASAGLMAFGGADDAEPAALLSACAGLAPSATLAL